MRVRCSMFGVRCLVLIFALLLLCAGPLFADSKDESLRPLGDGSSETVEETTAAQSGDTVTGEDLEEKYRAELEKRLAQERESYEGSLTSLWLANAAVWTVLVAFIIAQSFAARKRAAELARLKALREEE